MYKAKLFGFAVVCTVALVGMNTDAVLAAETNSEVTGQSNVTKNQKDTNKVFEDKMNEASQKWKSLTDKQKTEIYSLIESDMQSQNKVMDKLVEFGVIKKDDADFLKSRMSENYNKVKSSGEFPFYRTKSNKNRK